MVSNRTMRQFSFFVLIQISLVACESANENYGLQSEHVTTKEFSQSFYVNPLLDKDDVKEVYHLAVHGPDRKTPHDLISAIHPRNGVWFDPNISEIRIYLHSASYLTYRRTANGWQFVEHRQFIQ